MDLNNETILTKYKPLSPWAYFGYQLLFTIPLIGFIFLLVFAFNNDNINRRNFARSYFCSLILAIIIILIMVAIVTSTGISSSGMSNVL